MPLKITSDRPAVMELVAAAMAATPTQAVDEAVRGALREYYGFAPEDGIYGGSEAALCLGYNDYHPDEDLMDKIVDDLAEDFAKASKAPAGP